MTSDKARLVLTGEVARFVSGLMGFGVCMAFACDAAAYQQHINVTRKAVEATGTNAVVVQVEAPSKDKAGNMSWRNFAPDKDNVNFQAVDIRLLTEAKTSQHSNTVAQLFFGSKRSIAKGIDTAHVYSTTQWLRAVNGWNLESASADTVFPGPVINHSWVMNSRQAPLILRRVDYSAVAHNILHVAGVKRGGAGSSLMAGGYNTLVVGGAIKNIAEPYATLDEFYAEGRTRPHLVGPYPHASAAAPIVAAAAVRLNALAVSKDISNRFSNSDHREQLPVALVKAILMASASTDFSYSARQQDYVNAFGTLGVTDNGLDKRYGMGMLNVDAAERVLLATPDGVRAGETTAGRGFAYATHTEGQELRYGLRPERDGLLVLTLAWLADVSRDNNTLTSRLDDFDVTVFGIDRTGASQAAPVRLARSAATADTTESLRVNVTSGSRYDIVVTRKNDGPDWPFALAWNLRR